MRNLGGSDVFERVGVFAVRSKIEFVLAVSRKERGRRARRVDVDGIIMFAREVLVSDNFIARVFERDFPAAEREDHRARLRRGNFFYRARRDFNRVLFLIIDNGVVAVSVRVKENVGIRAALE